MKINRIKKKIVLKSEMPQMKLVMFLYILLLLWGYEHATGTNEATSVIRELL
jgi:hypothetical protein